MQFWNRFVHICSIYANDNVFKKNSLAHSYVGIVTEVA